MPVQIVSVEVRIEWDGPYCVEEDGQGKGCGFHRIDDEDGETYCLRYGKRNIGERRILKRDRDGRCFRCKPCLKETP